MVETVLRPARSGDAAEIARLATALGYPATAEEMAARLSRLLGDAVHHITVAVGNGDKLQGWIHAEERFSLESGAGVELMGLVVDSALRRQGIGRSLLSHAEQWAKQRGHNAIRVRSNVIRASSHPFYESCGYTRDKTQYVYSRSLPDDPTLLPTPTV